MMRYSVIEKSQVIEAKNTVNCIISRDIYNWNTKLKGTIL